MQKEIVEIKNKPDSLPTVRSLVNSYLDIEHQKYEAIKPQSEITNVTDFYKTLENEQELIEEQMLAKTNNIKHVLTALDMSEASIRGERQTLKQYESELRRKEGDVKVAKERVKKLIMDIVEHAGEPTKTGGMTIKTDLGKFTTYETDGPVNCLTEDLNNYPELAVMKYTKLDKTALKKHMKNTNQTELVNSNGDVVATIHKVKRLKIS